MTKTKLQNIIEAYFTGGAEALKSYTPADLGQAADVMHAVANVCTRTAAPPKNIVEKFPTDGIALGDGATLIVGSDRYPLTVIAKTAKTVTCQRDHYRSAHGQTPLDSSDSQYIYTPDTNGSTLIVRLTKRGWRSGGTPVSFGLRRFYQDPSF